jgi:hypothetical protein
MIRKNRNPNAISRIRLASSFSSSAAFSNLRSFTYSLTGFFTSRPNIVENSMEIMQLHGQGLSFLNPDKFPSI